MMNCFWKKSERRNMAKVNKILCLLVMGFSFFIPGVCSGDESELFPASSGKPRVLILMDLSSSMSGKPDMTPGAEVCDPDKPVNDNCGKVYIAKNAIKAVLDVNGDGVLDGKEGTEKE